MQQFFYEILGSADSTARVYNINTAACNSFINFKIILYFKKFIL